MTEDDATTAEQPTDTLAAEPAPAAPSTIVLPAPEAWNPILATTVAKTTPAPATCPAGTDPNVAGPIDQQRPHPGWVGNLAAAFDQHTGRIVYVDEQGETWTFDVCANRWHHMSPTGSPWYQADPYDPPGTPDGIPGSLVYDADSDVTVALGYEGVAVYDANTNTWTRMSHDTVSVDDGWFWPQGPVYDPISGLILTTHRGESGSSSDLWAYDVDTNTWSTIGTIPGALRRRSTSWATRRRSTDSSSSGSPNREPTTALLDPRTGETTVISTETPAYGYGFGTAVYGPAGDTVYVKDAESRRTRLCGFDTTSLTWTCTTAPETMPVKYSVFAAAVGDPINNRLVLINGVYDDYWVSADDDVWAIDLDSGEWTQILEPTSP